MTELSAFDNLARHLVRLHGRAEAERVLRQGLEALSTVERAALAARWRTWARPKQLAPRRRWRRWGFLTGRGFGKTKAVASHVNDRVQRADAPLLMCLMAQDEQSSIDVQVLGPSGLVATAPPWCKPEWHAAGLQLAWPNGSRAYVRTPEVPGKVRGLEYHLGWATELQSWPVATRDEAWSNLLLSVRLGDAQIVWDATPKRRHPILRELLEDTERDGTTYPVVRGATHENARNLGDGYVDELERKYGGTTKGREELLGEMLEDAEHATASETVIERGRRPRPSGGFARCVIGIDPSVTSKKGSDTTGIVKSARGHDGQAYVLKDLTGKHRPEAWADLVLDEYTGDDPCDVVLVETNKGGELVVQNLRAAAAKRGLRVVELGRDEVPRRTAGVVYVRALYSQGSKLERAEPVGIAYQKGRVSHLVGADLASLEETLATWEPGPHAESPGDLDALVFTIVELLDLREERAAVARAGMRGIVQAQAALTGRGAVPRARGPSLAHLLRGGGRRI